MIFFAKSEIQEYELEAIALVILFYWFIFRAKLSEGWNAVINYLGYFSIIGIIFWQLYGDNFNENIFLIRIENKMNSAHLVTYLPIMVMAFWLSLKYRSSIYGCLSMLAIVAIHETIFSIIFDVQRLLTGSSLNSKMLFSWFGANFLFAVVLFIFFKYLYSEIVNKRIFLWTWFIYTISLLVWACYGFPVSIDTFAPNLYTIYYHNIWVNFVECVTWFQPLFGTFLALYTKNKDFRASSYLKMQLKYAWVNIKHEISRIQKN